MRKCYILICTTQKQKQNIKSQFIQSSIKKFFSKDMDKRYSEEFKTDDSYLFFPKVENRERLYDRIRKNFKRLCQEIGLYYCPRTKIRRTMYSIRHTFFVERYNKGASKDRLYQ